MATILTEVFYLALFLGIPRGVLGGCPSSFFLDEVREDLPVGTVLFNTTDGKLTRLEDTSGPIGLNTTQGSASYFLYLASPLDYETMPSTIQNHVYCSDSANPQAIRLEVTLPISDVNEFPPAFRDSPYTISLPEDTSVGSSVFQLQDKVYDNDTKNQQPFLYAVVNGSGVFSIDAGFVVLNKPLDFEQGPRQYLLNLSAEELPTGDGEMTRTSYTTLTIWVADVDEMGPVFSSDLCTLSIPERIYAGSLFYTNPPLSAVDGDGTKENITMTTDNSTAAQVRSHVTVLANGSLFVTGNVTTGLYNVNIRAYQNNRPADRFAVASVLITVFDVNDHRPVMSSASYTASVREDAEPGTIIATVVASDPDVGKNSSFKFHLTNTTTFRISTENTVGVVKLAEPLDWETTTNFSLQVYAQEDQSVELFRSNSSIILVNVLDVNDNSPVFEKTTYSFTMPQTAVKGQNVAQVRATDNDPGPNGFVSYRLIATTGAAAEAFVIETTSGSISLARNLTRADVGVVTLAVEASDSGREDERRSNTTQVELKITSVNLFPPVFNASSYNFTVLETAPLGSRVGWVVATDMDDDSLLYSLNNQTAFQLQGNPPALYVSSALDLDSASRSPFYGLKVQATDGYVTSTATVNVIVEYVNEYEPVMNQSVYVVQIWENATSGSLVQKISATDGDWGSDGVLTYRMLQNVERGPFAIDASSGAFILNCSALTCLDYEARSQYAVVVQAADGGQPPKSSAATVIVSVMDCNDAEPQFASNFTGTVTENTPAGYTVLRLQAHDPDTSEMDLVFSLSSVAPPGVLRMNSPYVVTNASLDAERTRVVTALVRVSDGVHTSTAALSITVLDVNDNLPQVSLEQSTVTIPENSGLGRKVVAADASDADVTNSGFTFWLEEGSGKFAINRTAGVIAVSGVFDRRVQSAYDVQVWVSDSGAPPLLNRSVLHVLIADSNSPPAFVDASNVSVSRYSFDVPENAPLGVSIGRVLARDPDPGSSGQVHYVISQGNGEGVFLLHETRGELTLARRLDYETTSTYRLVVEAVDNSLEPRSATATVNVNVENVVEAPTWPVSFPVVYMTLNSRCPGIQLAASSQDVMAASSSSQSDVTYSLTNQTDIFAIDDKTGLLTANIARLTLQTYNVGLRACSTANKTVCSDTVLTLRVEADDVITFCPPFLVVHVNESRSPGYLVTDVNTTRGDDHVIYFFLSPTLLFDLNHTSGEIRLNQPVDREMTGLYILQIVAVYAPTNASVTAQVTVFIDDAPDSVPSFAEELYEGEINENAPPGTAVRALGSRTGLMVTAHDPDLNSSLSYSIVRDNSEGAFVINSKTGELTANHSVDLEAMTPSLNSTFTLQVLVSDGYFNNTATVLVHIINVNDNRPQFQPDARNFTLTEATVFPLALASLNATDMDVGDSQILTYSILPDDDSLPFVVDPKRRLMLVSALDRENVAFYTFYVIATDTGGLNGSMLVSVAVEDYNDQSPRFEKSVYNFSLEEGSAGVGRSLIISAHDNDIGANANLTYSFWTGNDDNSFSISTINSSQAVVRVEKSLDRERTPSLRMEVIAKDQSQNPLTGTCTIEITIDDINDNPPRFMSSYYFATISEGAANNTRLSLVPSLQVADEDAGANGIMGVVYSLDAGSDVPFTVDSSTGDIRVFFTLASQHLDCETTPSYTLKVVATDDHGRGLNGTALVNITIINVNDYAPEFVSPVYHWGVREDTPLGHLLGYVNATDVDSDATSLRYYIYSGGQGRFYLDPLSGAMMVSGLLDRETTDHFDLKLEVYDGQLRGEAKATVTVEDVNDNCPVFHDTAPLLLYISENTAQQDLANITASDIDLGNNGSVSFFLNDTDASRLVRISPIGLLRSVVGLDHEKEDQRFVNFLVWARDDGSPPCATSLLVRLEVLDVNDHNPEVCQISENQELACFSRLNLTAVSGSSAGTFLAVLRVYDWDESSEGSTTLRVTKDEAGLFAFNPLTGVLTLATTLRREDLAARGLLEADNATYRAEVTGSDHGVPARNTSAELLLHILPQAPSMPVFGTSVFNFTVTENEADVEIGQVKATSGSEGGNMSYSVRNTDFFAVDRQGIITTSRPLDRESLDIHTFVVLASNGPSPSDTASAVVLVTVLDKNDNAPVFSSLEFYVTVKENVPDVRLLQLHATDKDIGDNGHLTFSILNTTLTSYFQLEDNSGVLYLRTPLDREMQSSYKLTVQVRDGGTPALSATAEVDVTVADVNDNPPVFSSDAYTGFLDENAAAPSAVLNVSAHDPDEGLSSQVVYELNQKDPMTSAFYINELTGTIYNSRKMDFEDGEQVYELSVLARDLGTPSLTAEAKVTIYVNNLPDVIPRLTLDPREVFLVVGTPPSSVVPVNISAGYGNFTFSISDGNDRNLFSIDPIRGELRVTSELTVQGHYYLTVKVTDENAPQYFATDQVHVTVTSVHMEQETYAAVLAENTAPPVLLVDVNCNAERAGVPVIYSIDSYTDLFYILPGSGQLYCNASLDREQRSEYVINVMVDLKNSLQSRQKREVVSTTEIVVLVKDVNDNPPQFKVNNTVFGILKSAPALTLVTILKAEDRDDVNNDVVYEAVSGRWDVFQVTSDGQVISMVPMNSVTENSFSLIAKATDERGNGLSAKLSIKILAISDDERFGLVANIPLATFLEKQSFILRNLSDILGVVLQLDKVEPHKADTVDDTKSDIYFYAFDLNGTAVPFDAVQQRVSANSDLIKALLNNSELIQVTEPPAQVKVEVRYKVGEAEIAIFVVSALIFVGCFVAILLVYRSSRKQKEFQAREEAATKARQRMEQSSRQQSVVTQDSALAADPEEPLELDMDSDDGQVFNPRMFLRKVQETAYRHPGPLFLEDQECVMYLGREDGAGSSSTTPHLRDIAIRRSLVEPRLPDATFDDCPAQPSAPDTAADSGIDQRSGSDVNDGSLSSLDVQQYQSPPAARESRWAGDSGAVCESARKLSLATASVEVKDETSAQGDTTPLVEGQMPQPEHFENPACHVLGDREGDESNEDEDDNFGLPAHPMVTRF